MAEVDLLAEATKAPTDLRTLILRPGYFFPSNPQDARELRGGVLKCLDMILGPLMYATALGIRAQHLGRVAVAVAKGGDDIVGTGEQQELFGNSKIREISRMLYAKEKKE